MFAGLGGRGGVGAAGTRAPSFATERGLPAIIWRRSEMDPASGIGIPVAFGAGLISFLSPCVLPLVPGYISAVAGVKDTRDLTAARVVAPSLAFVGSFSSIFIALGLLGQQALRGTLTGATAQHVCGAIIVVMGLLF